MQSIETMKAEIDLMENAMYLVSNGRMTKVKAKDFGTDEVIWKDGKWQDIISHKRIRNCGQVKI
ncbi:hypothetical protein [Sporolactobacillus terrae]|uniref:hypothetical protein n=1 Tax=Sporolactobacillus terrae TaxID=269673 RepID=UPI00048BD0C9|nr:hypothetical protein [Sporolactobacillus terrae]